MKLNLKNITFATVVAASLVATPSCEKVDFGSMNENPNLTSVPVTSALLTNALSGIGGMAWDAGGISTIAGLYAQYYAETQYTDASRYAKTTANWDGYYSGALYDLENIIINNEKYPDITVANGSVKNQIGIAKILKAYHYWELTDLWGDLPYSQALKEKSVIPYDQQENIYTNLLKEIKDATAGFDNGLALKGDILYSGDIAKWKKFANSLRLLISLQMSKVNPTLGKAEFAAALADPAGVIEDNAQNASLAYPGGVYNNPFWQYYNVTKRDDYSVGKPLLDWMNARSDLRNTKFGTTTVGFPVGLTRADAVVFGNANTNYARLMNTSVAAATSKVAIITAAHIWLARAEAANLTWTSENAEDAYKKGVTQSWLQWGLTDGAELTAYLASADVNFGGAEIPKKIATQQWIAWYPNGVQGWNVWRKTGYPALTPAPGKTAIPRRLSYGTNEPLYNAENYNAAATKYTASGEADSQFARVWWDKP